MSRSITIGAAAACGAIAFLLAGSPAIAAGPPSGKGTCKDIPLEVTISGVADVSQGGIYGETNTQDSVYTDGVGGVSATLRVCNGTNDFALATVNTKRYFNINFSRQLVAGDSAAAQPVAPYAYRGETMFIAGVANTSLYSNSVLNTSMRMPLGGALQSGWVIFCDPALTACSSGAQLTTNQTANHYANTSTVQVTSDCSTPASWSIAPFPTAAMNAPVAGLTEGDTIRHSAGMLSGGNYNMPFTIKLKRTDGGGCP